MPQPPAPASQTPFGGDGRDNGFDLERVQLATQVVDRLRHLVLTGQIPPGTKLLQEQVAAQLGVSRTPLREAIRILVHDGLLVTNPNNSVQVIELSDEQARDLYEVREVIDGLAARLCARNGLTSAQTEHLHDLASAVRDASDPFDVSAYTRVHAQFHIMILDYSGNSRAKQLEPVVGMSAQMLFHRYPTRVDRMRQASEEHFAILEAIASGDPAKAERAARRHIRAATAFWLPKATRGRAADATVVDN